MKKSMKLLGIVALTFCSAFADNGPQTKPAAINSNINARQSDCLGVWVGGSIGFDHSINANNPDEATDASKKVDETMKNGPYMYIPFTLDFYTEIGRTLFLVLGGKLGAAYGSQVYGVKTTDKTKESVSSFGMPYAMFIGGGYKIAGGKHVIGLRVEFTGALAGVTKTGVTDKTDNTAYLYKAQYSDLFRNTIGLTLGYSLAFGKAKALRAGVYAGFKYRILSPLYPATNGTGAYEANGKCVPSFSKQLAWYAGASFAYRIV